MVEPATLSINDEDYPPSGRRLLGNKAPQHLTCLGNLELLKTSCIGISGSRRVSNIGVRATKKLVEHAVSENHTIVSGGADGVDNIAHHQALIGGGNTILVSPCGMGHFAMHQYLKRVWDWNRVLIVCQFNYNDIWTVKRAMVRNKIIIALSKAMVVVEAGLTGGTMDAGIETMNMGVPLFAMQYEDNKTSEGNQKLIDDGATSFMLYKNNIMKFSEISEKIS